MTSNNLTGSYNTGDAFDRDWTLPVPEEDVIHDPVWFTAPHDFQDGLGEGMNTASHSVLPWGDFNLELDLGDSGSTTTSDALEPPIMLDDHEAVETELRHSVESTSTSGRLALVPEPSLLMEQPMAVSTGSDAAGTNISNDSSGHSTPPDISTPVTPRDGTCPCPLCIIERQFSMGYHFQKRGCLCGCDKECFSFLDWTKHYKTLFQSSSSPTEYLCQAPACKQKHKRWGDLKRHYKAHCLKPQTFPCDVPYCKFSGSNGFVRRDKLLSHKRNMHDGKSTPDQLLRRRRLMPKPIAEGQEVVEKVDITQTVDGEKRDMVKEQAQIAAAGSGELDRRG